MNQSYQTQIVALNKLDQPRQFVCRFFSIWERGIYWGEDALPIGNVAVKQGRYRIAHIPQKVHSDSDFAKVAVYLIFQRLKTGLYCLFK